MKWKFEKVKQPSNFNFDGLLKKFFEYGLMGLVRENIQNSLDAKDPLCNEPVHVSINMDEMPSSLIPGFDEIKHRIMSLKGHNDYTKKTIAYMKKNINNPTCKFMTFEDTNTKGLSGAKAYDDSIGGNPYRAYAYSKGVHVYDQNKEKERSRGGSHGVGKIASNAASLFHLMYFANCDDTGYQTLGGTVELIDHNMQGSNYFAKGYYTDENEHNLIPYINTMNNTIFEKKTRGLKIIIPFLKKDYYDEKATIVAVIESFLLAILNDKLIVTVNDKILDSNTIVTYIQNTDYFTTNIEDIDEYFTPLYLETYTNHYKNEILIYDKDEAHSFDLYLMHHTDIKNGRTGIFRNVGMKIEDKKILSKVRAPYNAILIPKTSKEDEFLKSLENEAHNKLEYTHISDEQEKDNAKYFINQINKEIGLIVDEILAANSPVEGKLDTGDILYVTEEDKFKTLLRNRLSVINTSRGKNKKSIVKVTKTEEPGEEDRDRKGGKKHLVNAKRVKTKLGDDIAKEYFQLSGGIIKRVTTNDNETIYINLSQANFLNITAQKVNLFVRLVDGMGKEYNNEYNLINQYRYIEDMNAYEKLVFEENVIKNVDVSQRTIKLHLKPKNNQNRYTKLRFYLEV
ncbi:MAG: hypothetical protein ACOCUE_04760 [Candidatus Izemoplasmataceae bacterium]